MSSAETEPPPPPPSALARRWSGALIAGFVLLQFLIPLSYLARDDRTDERFTWRRFTTGAVESCETSASLQRVDGGHEEIALQKLIHRDWVTYLAQGRRAVVDAFLQKQCEADGVLRVEVVNRCDDERGTVEYELRCGSERTQQNTRTALR
ncbi:MAG: hypothetical protein WCE62_13975 [Polyangiales bacterium]